MELWTVVAEATTTTIATTTRAATTTLQTSTTLGAASGDGGGSELRAALIGALVGGLASGLAALGGSVIVERMKITKAARMRMHEELLPPILSEIAIRKRPGFSLDEFPDFDEIFYDRIEQLERVGVLAGRKDRRLTRNILRKATEHRTLIAWPGEKWQGAKWAGDWNQLQALAKDIQEGISDLDAHLRRKVD
jgi:hypothetical protein